MTVDLNSLVIFAKVVEANSFSEAARRLGIPVSTVSRRVLELESEMGVRLLERSTRTSRLTDIGAEVLQHARRGVELNDAVQNVISRKLSGVSGTLRLSAPPNISDTLVAPMVNAFQAEYPDVRFEIFITERYVDHIVEGFDLVFRLGAPKDSALVARKLLTYRHQLVASPAYLAEHGMPRRPQDLPKHRLIAFSYRRPQAAWEFVHRNRSERETITFLPYLAINDFAGLTPALLSGVGIGVLPPVVQPDLMRSGQLVEVMPAWRFQTYDLSLVHLGNRLISPAVRLFKDFAAQKAIELFPKLPA